VDADEDLVALCSRMQATDSKHCAILYCDEVMADDSGPISTRPASVPPRAYH
jgi:hypothetical protein